MTLAIDNLDENNIREVIAFLRKFRKKEKVKATILLFKDQTFSSRLKESGFDKNSDIESILHKFFFEDKEFYLKILDLIFSVLNEQKTEVSEKVTVTLPEKEEEMKKFLNENLDQIILGLELEYKKIFTDNFFKEEQRFFITKLLYNNQYSFELSKLIADIFLDKDDEIYEKLTNLLKTDKISKPLLEASFNGLEQKTELIIAFLDDITNSKYWKYLVICNWAGKIILEKVKQIYFENDLPLMDFHDETAIIHKKIISFVNWAYEIENNEKEDLARKLEEYYYYADNENEEEKSKKELIDLFIDPFPWLS